MIRCPKHGIDKDVCDCIDYTSQDYDKAYPKSHIAITWVGFMFFLILLALMVGAVSCAETKKPINRQAFFNNLNICFLSILIVPSAFGGIAFT